MWLYSPSRVKSTKIIVRRGSGRPEGDTVFGSTMLLTIGQALDRAKDDDLTVRMNIGSDWISGRILTNDAQAIAVLETNGDLCVIRKDIISCVRMAAQTHTEHVASERTEDLEPELGVLENAVGRQA